MAAVEKRKNGWAALLINHIMFMVICTFMIPILNGIPKLLIGGFMSLLYFNGVHEYCRKSAREHIQPYSAVSPSWKFPLYYGFIGNVIFWFPIIMQLTIGTCFEKGTMGKIIINIIYLVLNSPFIFVDIFTSNDYNVLNITPVIVFSLLFFGASFLGYYLGKYDKSIAKFLSKFKKKKKSKKKTGGIQ